MPCDPLGQAIQTGIHNSLTHVKLVKHVPYPPAKLFIDYILNRILDEHRAFAHAGLIPEEVYYSYRTYSSKGRTQISVGVSPENIAYIEKARNNGELAPTAACNKLLDEYRAVMKKYR